MRIVVGKI